VCDAGVLTSPLPSRYVIYFKIRLLFSPVSFHPFSARDDIYMNNVRYKYKYIYIHNDCDHRGAN